MISPAQYVNLSGRTEKHPEDIHLHLNPKRVAIIHAALGLSSEVGELVSDIKAHVIYNKILPKPSLSEEIGDILWYLAIILREYDLDFSQIMAENISKLSIRYPDAYSDYAANARKDKDV